MYVGTGTKSRIFVPGPVSYQKQSLMTQIVRIYHLSKMNLVQVEIFIFYRALICRNWYTLYYSWLGLRLWLVGVIPISCIDPPSTDGAQGCASIANPTNTLHRSSHLSPFPILHQPSPTSHCPSPITHPYPPKFLE